MKVTFSTIATALVAAAIAFGLFVALGASQADAKLATIEVTTTDDVIANDGFCSLREAIRNANAIFIGLAPPAGECANGSLGPDVVELTIVADYVLASPLPEIKRWDLDIVGNGATIDADGVGRVLHTTANLNLTDLTLTGGDAGSESGGAIFAEDGAAVTLLGVEVTNNRAKAGGGIAVEDGELTVALLSVVHGNHAGLFGGGISAVASDVQIADSDVTSNVASSDGGGLHADDGTVAITDSMFGANEAGDHGGGMYLATTEATIIGTLVDSNVATDGGGINLRSGPLELSDSELTANEAANGGGIFVHEIASATMRYVNADSNEPNGIANDGSIAINESTIESESGEDALLNGPTGDASAQDSELGYVANAGSLQGTRIHVKSEFVGVYGIGPVNLTESTVEVDGESDDVAAVMSWAGLTLYETTISGSHTHSLAVLDSTADIRNSTMRRAILLGTASVGVTHTTVTEGILLDGATLTIGGSLITGPDAGLAIDLIGGTITSAGYNVLGSTNTTGVFGASDQTDVLDAGLTSLALRDGGVTPTHGLATDSVAIDFVSGPLAAGLSTPATDQNGTARPLGANADAGAYEATPVVVAPPATCDGKTVTINMLLGDPGVGTPGDDVILGTSGDDVIDGLGGNDTVCAGDGADTIEGGDGNDTIYAGEGDDTTTGGLGNDVIHGEGGLDFIYGGEGDDEMTGGTGNDRIRGQQGEDTIDGGDDNDFLYGGVDADTINGGNGRDLIGGFGGADIINAGPGNDTVFGGFGPDTINGGDGDDKLNGLIGNDTIHGDAGNDVLNGGNGQDQLFGDGNDDTLNGGNSLDTLIGGSGNDQLNGGKSEDTLSGGPDTDTCTGNKGTDTADATCEATFGIP